MYADERQGVYVYVCVCFKTELLTCQVQFNFGWALLYEIE